MFRRALVKRDLAFADGFRLRGREVSRLEGFSDAVFGFALTLLVVSLDVPQNFNDFANALRGFPAFAFCFLMLAAIWNSHYKYCRRFGLDDGWSRFLTCALLFLVLFFVYPLKFLFTIGINSLLFRSTTSRLLLTRAQFSALEITYALGFVAVYSVLTLLYLHAYRLRETLELTEEEQVATRYQIARLLLLIAVGLTAAVLSILPFSWRWSGLVYMLLFPILSSHRILHRRRRAQLAESAPAL